MNKIYRNKITNQYFIYSEGDEHSRFYEIKITDEILGYFIGLTPVDFKINSDFEIWKCGNYEGD